MRWTKPSLLFLTVSLALTVLVKCAYSNAEVSPTWHFGLPSLDTYINFESTQNLTTIQRQNNYWTFDSYQFQVQNANLTINKFFEDRQLIFTVNASTGVNSTTRVYIPGKSAPEEVDGATSWTFDWETGILTVNVQHSSPEEITATWSQIGWMMDINALVVWFWVVIGLLGVLPLGIALSAFMASLKKREVPWRAVPTLILMALLVLVAILILRALIGVF